MNENNSTANTVLVILLVVVVGFIVWFVMARKAPTDTSNKAPIEVNLNGGNTNNPPSSSTTQ